MKSAEKNERYIRISRFADAVREYEEVETKLTLTDGSVADKIFCDTAEELLNSIENQAILLESKEKEYNAALTSVDAVNQNGKHQDVSVLEEYYKEKYEEIHQLSEKINTLIIKKESSKPKINSVLLIIGIIIILGGIATFTLLKPFVSGGICTVGLISVILSFILKKKPNNKDLESELEVLNSNKAQLNNELADLKTKIEEAKISISTNKSLNATYRENAVRLQSELLEIKNTLFNAKTELFAHLGKYPAISTESEAKQVISEIEELIEVLKELRITAEYAAKGTGCATLKDAEKALSFLKEPTDINVSLDDLKTQREQIRKEVLTVSEEYNVLFGKAAAAYKGLRTPAEIEREIAETTEHLNELQEYYSLLETVEETLGEAFSDLRKNFSGVLEQTALQIFSALTNDKYGGITISKNFDISVSETADFGSQPIDYLSKGAKGQAYFALRLALSQLLNEDNQPLPIILDDIFAQFDDKRTDNGFKFLNDYAKENQVIFFTCHKENLNKNNNINIVRL